MKTAVQNAPVQQFQSVDKAVYEKMLHKSCITVAGPAEHSWSGVQRAEALWSLSAESEISSLRSAPQGVNFKTVQWTVLKEGTPCKRGRPLNFVQIHSLLNLFRQAETAVQR